MNHTIKTNAKGSREMTVTDDHLATIKRYALMSDLVDSNGIVDETVVGKLRLHVRHLLEGHAHDEALLSLARDVVFHDNMKAYALHQLLELYLGRDAGADVREG